MSRPPIQLDTAAGGSELRLADLLPDYLNDHLSAPKRAEVEAALAVSQRMRDQLAFQSRLQVSLRAEAQAADEVAVTVAESRGSGFAAVADRIVDSPFTRLKDMFQELLNGVGTPALMPAFALMLVVGLVANLETTDSSAPINNDFETRTSVEDYSEPTLRIFPRVAIDSEEFDLLLSDYGLQLEVHLKVSEMAEVTPVRGDVDLEALAAALIEDDRVEHASALSNSASERKVEE